MRRDHHARRLRQPRAPGAGAGDAASLPRRLQAEIPHYFRHLFTDDAASRRASSTPAASTGRRSRVRRLDHRLHRRLVRRLGRPGTARLGRSVHHRGLDKAAALPEVIARGEPAIMVCHWPGIYFNGDEDRLQHLQGSRRDGCTAIRQPDLDEEQRDRPLLGGEGADED